MLWTENPYNELRSFCALPLVFCPSPEIRNLRRLFSTYQALIKTIVAQKNAVVGVLRDVGVKLGVNERYGLYNGKAGLSVLSELELNEYVYATVEPLVTIICMCTEKKKDLQKTIIAAGRSFQDDVELLISIKGITPLSALAFISDIADLSRFTSARKVTAYLGLVPLVKSSGDRIFHGNIIRASRSLTRTLLTQSVQHIVNSNPDLNKWYHCKKNERGAGRARIGVIRRTVKIMRSILLSREKYRYIEEDNYCNKIILYRKVLKKEDKAA